MRSGFIRKLTSSPPTLSTNSGPKSTTMADQDQSESPPKSLTQQADNTPPPATNPSTNKDDSSTKVSADVTTNPAHVITDESPLSLGLQMAAMRTTLDHINTNLTSLNSSVHNLELAKSELKAELKEDFSKLRADINSDMASVTTTYEGKLSALDSKLTEDHFIRCSEIVADLDAHKLVYNLDIDMIKKDLSCVSALKTATDKQSDSIKALKDAIDISEEKWTRLESILSNHMDETARNFAKVFANIDELMEMNNQLEAHERRWAIRIKGLKAPPKNKKESTPEAKTAILNFLATKLDIKNISPLEMDTAHRLGPIKDGNQTILVRFFRREIVDIILNNKRMLKGETMSLTQDTTRRNRTLMWELSQRAEVESSWNQSGSVWAKLHSNPNKVRVKITDNIDDVLKKHHISAKIAKLYLAKRQAEASSYTSSLQADNQKGETPPSTAQNENGSPSTVVHTSERPLIIQQPTNAFPDGQSSTPTIKLVPDPDLSQEQLIITHQQHNEAPEGHSSFPSIGILPEYSSLAGDASGPEAKKTDTTDSFSTTDGMVN
jgi:hypothetical protein